MTRTAVRCILLASRLKERFECSERGATLAEYSMLVALVAVACLASAKFLGGAGASKFKAIGSSIS